MESCLLRITTAVVLALWISAPCSKAETKAHLPLQTWRSAADDLEISGNLAGALGTPRFIRYSDLLALPQETATNDPVDDFSSPFIVTGVPLASLARLLGAKNNLIVAVCSDGYRGHFPTDYIAAHAPILVLKINGLTHDSWKQFADHGDVGPYFIANPHFAPSFHLFSHEDESQNPYGVVRLEVRDERLFHARFRPPLRYAESSPEFMGYRIAMQNCLRCHNLGSDGGEKAGRSWYQLAAWAHSNPTSFKRYVGAPLVVMPCSRMPARPSYDAQTLDALTAYFRSFFTEALPVPARIK